MAMFGPVASAPESATLPRSSDSPLVAPRDLRPEIQALRAIAVLGVVTYHLWPHVVHGGFIGVDIFFVISGFLITSHLLREVAKTGRIKLASFWARRARRLLPASLLVIAASFLATIAFAPASLWDQFDSEFAASALYVQNWLLAFNSVDYLAADNAASPVQHYWSLSVEEQFYVVWPLLILAGIGIAALVSRVSRRTAIAVVLTVVTGASLIYCVLLTHFDPAPAYFVTTTRAWEFGLGGLLALLLEKPRPGNPVLRAVLSWGALAVIVLTNFYYTSSISFPGYRALLPTVATALVIYAGVPDVRWAPSRLMGLRPVQWLGDISYSFYLWHWPPIILLPFVFDHGLTWIQRILILVASIVLAWLTKRFVEDPVRRARWLNRRTPYLTLALTAVTMIAIVVSTTTASTVKDAQIASTIAQNKSLTRSGTDCLGAAAVAPDNQPCVNPSLKGKLLPDAAAGERDWVIPPDRHCRTGVYSPKVLFCTFLKPTSQTNPIRIALVGDSHAEQWLPAVQIIAKQHGWGLDTYLKGGCPFSTVERADNESTSLGSCATWNNTVMQRLAANPYSLIITSEVTGSTFVTNPGETSQEAGVRGLVAQWDKVQAMGTEVVAIRDGPSLPRSVPQCLSGLHGDVAAQVGVCAGKEATALHPDPQVKAAQESGAGLIDLTEFFCQHSICPAVIGSVVVYRDNAHLGGTYSRSLAPYLGRQLTAYLADHPLKSHPSS